MVRPGPLIPAAAGWGGQLRKGALDIAILGHLAAGDMHGYALIASLKQRGLMAPEGGAATVYQALQRLADQGLAHSAWSAPGPDEGDRPRKVYTITMRGHSARKQMASEWQNLKRALDHLLEETA